MGLSLLRSEQGSCRRRCCAAALPRPMLQLLPPMQPTCLGSCCRLRGAAAYVALPLL